MVKIIARLGLDKTISFPDAHYPNRRHWYRENIPDQ